MVLVNIVKKDKINNSECKSIKKSRNKIVKISTKLKSWNLLKSKSRNLFNFKKIQNTGVIEKPNFLISNTRVVFIKLR